MPLADLTSLVVEYDLDSKFDHTLPNESIPCSKRPSMHSERNHRYRYIVGVSTASLADAVANAQSSSVQLCA